MAGTAASLPAAPLLVASAPAGWLRHREGRRLHWQLLMMRIATSVNDFAFAVHDGAVYLTNGGITGRGSESHGR
jgi:hypothetical protein